MLRLVHNNDDNQLEPRRNKSEWIKVADQPLWGDRLDVVQEDNDNQIEPYGEIEVWCYRTPRTELENAPFMLRVLPEDGKPIALRCSQSDLSHLALAILNAAQHAWPKELQTAGYLHAIEPWFTSFNNEDDNEDELA